MSPPLLQPFAFHAEVGSTLLLAQLPLEKQTQLTWEIFDLQHKNRIAVLGARARSTLWGIVKIVKALNEL
eukprot:489740-Rhodomonas_salina.1